MQVEMTLESGSLLNTIVAGTDEVGRGPLAGDVFAAAVVLDDDCCIEGMDDSKKLTDKDRRRCSAEIISSARAWAIAQASVEEIDEINILRASLLAMHRAVTALHLQPEFVYVDGTFCPEWHYQSLAVVQGDSRVECIAAASIIAKVARDDVMIEMDTLYPGYGFARHKGYATAEHLLALRTLGPCPIHRRSFRPVADRLKR
ncbi:MAG: ribonuclease HII [Pseudohongiellaceae bacterium]